MVLLAQVAVSDTSPVIGLCAVDQLPLLGTLFGELLVPDEVWWELIIQDGAPEPEQLLNLPNVRFVAPLHPPPQTILGLGVGERNAIAVALEHPGAILLMDDYAARREAGRLGVRSVGVLRVLIHAKCHGLLADIRPLLVGLRASGFRLSKTVANHVLALVKEEPL